MTIKNIGANQTELKLANGTVVLVSYSTPVAAYNLRGHDVGGFRLCKTSQFFSKTTSKHIKNWTQTDKIEEKPQSFFDDLIK